MMRYPSFARAWLALLAVLLAAAAGAAPQPGVAYVHTARGEIPLGGDKLARGLTFEFAKQKLDVPASLPLVLALSNGTGLSVPRGARLTLEEFVQEPIVDTSLDREFEPSRTALTVALEDGTLAVSARIPNPTTTFLIRTPLAELRCLARRFAVTVTADQLVVAVLDGTVTLTIPDTGYTTTVQTTQVATLTRANLRQQYPLTLEYVTETQKRELQEWIGMGAWAAARVDFTHGGGRPQPRLVLPLTFTKQLSADEPRFRQ